MDSMDKLIEKALRTLERDYSVNEVELSNGVDRVRVVRNTPAPTISCPTQIPYSTY